MKKIKRVLWLWVCPFVFPTLKVPNEVKAIPKLFLFSCFSQAVTKLHVDWPSWKVELYRIVKSSLIFTRRIWFTNSLGWSSPFVAFMWLFSLDFSCFDVTEPAYRWAWKFEVWSLNLVRPRSSIQWLERPLVTCWCSQIRATITECMSQVLYIAYQFTANIISPIQRHVTGATCKYQ